MEKRSFKGMHDDSAVILEKVFPDSDLIFSTPVLFDGNKSSVYIEGSYNDLEKIYNFLYELFRTRIDERYFGKWIGLVPPDENMRVVMQYKTLKDEFEKIHLLNFVLRKQLAEICRLHLSRISNLIVRVNGKEIQKTAIALPEHINNGDILLSRCALN